VADVMLKKWIESFKATDLDDIDDLDPFGRELHPRIKAEFDAVKDNAHTKISILDACKRINTHTVGVREKSWS
jgi:hypothetical protein